MLIDTGCDRTLVSEELVDPSKINWTKTAQVLCLHGHAESYPTAKVKLRIEGNDEERDVVVAPKLPMAVLIGRDITGPTGQNKVTRNNEFAVLTRSQAKRTATEEADASHPDKSKGAAVQEPRGEVDSKEPAEASPTEEVLHVTPGELCQWQQEDSSLKNVRGRAEQQKDPKARVQFFYRDGLLYRCWCPRGSLPLSHRILKPTEVFLLYICVLKTLSNYAGGLRCEAGCQLELGQYTNISIYRNTDNRNIISITVSIY